VTALALRGKGRGRRRSVRPRLAPYVFVAPFAALFAAVFIAPLAYALYLSLFREQLVGGTVFAGLGNYTEALGDEQFRAGVGRLALLLVTQVPVTVGLGLLFALLLDSGRISAPRLFRLGVFLPFAVPAVVAALMWGYFYAPEFGPVTQIADALGLPEPKFLTGSTLLASLGNIVNWEFAGYNMIIFFAALRAIPNDLYDAAAVDGASDMRVALAIKLPLLRPALLLVLIFSVIGTFQLFNEPQVLIPLAPDVIGRAFTPNLYAWNLAFTDARVNYAAAISFLLGFVILAISYAVLLLTNRKGRPA